MSWLDKLFKKEKETNKTTMYADMLNGYTPVFSQWGKDVYVNDVVHNAVHKICQEISKTTPTHCVREDVYDGSNNLNDLLNNPNDLMTKSDFLEKITYALLTNYNAYIMPSFATWVSPNTGEVKKVCTSLYPVIPTGVEFIQDDSNELFIKLKFANMKYETTLPYKDVIHLRYEFSASDIMGGDVNGQPDRRSLLNAIKLNDDMFNGIQKGMNESSNVQGIVKYHGIINKEATEAAVQEFEYKLKNSQSGLMALDDSVDYIKIDKDIKMVDTETLNLINQKLLMSYGVSVAILTGDYTKAQYEAFFQSTLEPIIGKLGEAFSKVLLTKTQIAKGHRIKFFTKDLVFMTTAETLELIRLLGDSGALYENEKRTLLGLKPLPELNGIRTQSLNYVNTDIANKYQIGEAEQEQTKKEVESDE